MKQNIHLPILTKFCCQPNYTPPMLNQDRPFFLSKVKCAVTHRQYENAIGLLLKKKNAIGRSRTSSGLPQIYQIINLWLVINMQERGNNYLLNTIIKKVSPEGFRYCVIHHIRQVIKIKWTKYNVSCHCYNQKTTESKMHSDSISATGSRCSPRDLIR